MRNSEEKMTKLEGEETRTEGEDREAGEGGGREKGEERGDGRAKVGGYAPDTSLVRGVGALK